MNSELKKDFIKSATAIACAVSVCVTASVSVGKLTDAMKESATLRSTASTEQESTDSAVQGAFESDATTDETIDAVTPVEESEIPAEESSDVAADSSAGTSTEKTQASSNTSSTKKDSSGVPSTKAEILNYFNTAINKVKPAKPGYSKHYTMGIMGDSSGAINLIKGLVTKDETTTIKKGTDSTEEFPVAGFNWTSKLRESDIQSATLKQNGQYYDIEIKLGKETNPGKGELSKYGRIVSVIDAADAAEKIPGIKSVTMNYYNGYAKVRVDSKTGKVVSAEFSATADIVGEIALVGSIKANQIVSTETFTNFVW